MIVRRTFNFNIDPTKKAEVQKALRDLSLQIDDIVFAINRRGPSANRPRLDATQYGTSYYDTTLGIPIWWNGTAWKNAAGGGV